MRAWLLPLCLLWGVAAAQTLTRPPKLIRFVEAEAPAPGGATVVLQIDIAATGAVAAVEVLESGGAAFDAAAVDAAKRFEFAPAEIDGQPAPIRVQYRYTFTARIEAPPPPTPVTLRGQVVDPQGAPVAGAQVAIGPARRVAGLDGRFEVPDLAPGLYVVEISAPRRITARTTVDARQPGAVITLRPVLAKTPLDVDEELVIRAPRRIRAQTEVAIRADEARTVAGTQGDTLKVVQSLPGVARAAAGSAALVVWGAAPEDTRVLVDGVEIPALYHLGGVRSTINSALVESIELVPGAFGPAYGRGLGGLVKVQTRRLPEALTGYVAADLYDASAMLSAPLGASRRIAAAARVGYLDRVFAGVVEDPTVFPIPRYLDAQLRLEQDLRADEWIGLVALLSDDQLDRRVDRARDRQARRSATIYAPYRRILGDGASLAITPSVVAARRTLDARFGATPARQQVDSVRFGLRGDYRAALTDQLTLALGTDTVVEDAKVEQIGSLNRPPREGDVAVFGQPPGDDVAADALGVRVADVAIHGRVEWALGPVTLVPGLRADLFALSSDRLEPPIGEAPRLGSFRLEPALAPRVQARWRIVDGLTLHAATGRYHQPPPPEALSPVFGNARLGLSRATHGVAGVQWQPLEGLDVEVTGFVERFEALIARNTATTPPLGEALTQAGAGQSRGVQLLVRRSTGRLTGWLSYTLSRSTRTDAPDRPARPFDFDQTHVLSLVLGHRWERLTVSGRARYATGFPRTPVIGAVFDAQGDRFQPRFGAQNSVRIPAFAQLDLRAEYTRPLPIGVLTLSLDVLNATARENVEELAYTHDFSAERPVPGLPLLAILGARWDF